MTITPADIEARADEVGDCLIWHGSISGEGYPTMKCGGACRLVRRVMMEAQGIELAPRQPVITTCGEKLCVSRKHLKKSTVALAAQAAAARGAYSRPDRRAKIAAGKRKIGKLSMAIAREIRLSTETGPVLAARYGVNRSLINRIKNGKAWEDFSSPFAGLLMAASEPGRARV